MSQLRTAPPDTSLRFLRQPQQCTLDVVNGLPDTLTDGVHQRIVCVESAAALLKLTMRCF
jgi:hypothetical protein